MLKPRSPAVGPQMLERRDDAGCRQSPALGRDPGGGIEAGRKLHLARVEVAYVVDPRARDRIEDVVAKIAVRIDDGDALTGVDVAEREIKEERRFARSGFADNVDVALALLARKDNASAVGGRG